MTHDRLHSIHPALRFGVIALWMLSLMSVGVSPLYYITTSIAAPAVAGASQEVAHDVLQDVSNDPECFSGCRMQASQSDGHGHKQSVTVRLTLNPFLAKVGALQSKSPDCGPLENDGGMKSSAPHSSPVVLWLVGASASGAVSSSHWTRTYYLEESDELFKHTTSISHIPAGAIHAEHPNQRFAATLLGQKPSGVS